MLISLALVAGNALAAPAGDLAIPADPLTLISLVSTSMASPPPDLVIDGGFATDRARGLFESDHVFRDNQNSSQRQSGCRRNSQTCFFARTALRFLLRAVRAKKHVSPQATYVNRLIVVGAISDCRQSIMHSMVSSAR
jgi:hypothetical protein